MIKKLMKSVFAAVIGVMVVSVPVMLFIADLRLNITDKMHICWALLFIVSVALNFIYSVVLALYMLLRTLHGEKKQ